MRETDWTRTVIDTAMLHGWRVSHSRPARTAQGWRTPVQGHIGAPDLLLARAGRVLCVELKSDRGRLRPDQRVWLDHLGEHGRIWRPADLDTVLHELKRGART
jgi:VRR-NUC domain-containing protein